MILPVINNFFNRAPKSAAGFKKLWDSLNTDQWGAADVSISVKLRDGRSVWLYGDTFSGSNGFVHSTAITQTGARLHVSCGGKQLIPDDSKQEIYWIETAVESRNNVLNITCAPILIGNSGPWDFKRRNVKSRIAEVSVNKNGDCYFIKWLDYVNAPPPHADFKIIGPNHFTYAEEIHPQFKMSSGKKLHTICQNWDDALSNHVIGGKFQYNDYRPIFVEK